MNVGDIVRVTCAKYPDAAMEGTVTEIETHPRNGLEVTYKTLWSNTITVSLSQFDVTVIRAVEPQEIGSTHTTDKGITYVRYAQNLDRRWVLANSPNLFTYTWEELTE